MLKQFLTIAVLAAALPGPVIAAVSAGAPEGVAAVLRRGGYSPRMDRDADGDPMIRFRIATKSVQLRFYGCVAGQGCMSMQLTTGYDLPDGMDPALANQWMRENRWGKVHLDEDRDPFLQYDIAADPPGLPDGLFLGIVATYRDAVERFSKFVGF